MCVWSAGRPSAAIAPPSGTAICRMPRARPRSSSPNQAITARPLAALTPAPTTPVSASAATSLPNDEAYAAQSRAAAAPDCPIAACNCSLPDPVGDETPGQQRDDRSEADRSEHDADLGQREPELLPDRRRDRRQAEQDRRVGRLRDDAGGENRPAVSRRRRGRGAHEACAVRRHSGLCRLRPAPRG